MSCGGCSATITIIIISCRGGRGSACHSTDPGRRVNRSRTDHLTERETPSMTDQQQGESTEVEVLSPETSQKFLDMIVQLPVEDGTKATDRIVAELLAASDLDGLNAPFESDQTAAMVGRLLVITGVKVLSSRFAGGVGAFMRAESIDANDGTDASFSTGSLSIMAQLTNAWVRKAFPLRAIVTRAERPTAKGYFPMQLKVLAEHASATVRPGGK